MNDETLPKFSAGEYIQRFLQQRGWSQTDLAQVMGRPTQVVNEIILGRRGVSPRTARELAAAFGTSVEVWRNIDRASRYNRPADTTDDVQLRAKVYSKGPINEMIRRGWIAGTRTAEELGDQVVAFYGLPNLDAEPTFEFHAARKGTSYSEVTLSQVAWLHQARHLAEDLEPSGTFTDSSLGSAVERLKQAARDEQGVSEVPAILDKASIRFVIVEHLPKTRIDGATFWLKDGSPVIAMSMRYERIDHFWHTLFHELAHVKARDGFDDPGRLDTDLPGSHTPVFADRPPSEKAADEYAAATLIDQAALAAFISLNRPLFSRRKIIEFARVLRVHPGILVGQLQYCGEILYSHSRDLLVSVRDIITSSAKTDGWNKAKRNA